MSIPMEAGSTFSSLLSLPGCMNMDEDSDAVDPPRAKALEPRFKGTSLGRKAAFFFAGVKSTLRGVISAGWCDDALRHKGANRHSPRN